MPSVKWYAGDDQGEGMVSESQLAASSGAEDGVGGWWRPRQWRGVGGTGDRGAKGAGEGGAGVREGREGGREQ